LAAKPPWVYLIVMKPDLRVDEPMPYAVLLAESKTVSWIASGRPSTTTRKKRYPDMPLTFPAPWIIAVPFAATNHSALVATKLKSLAANEAETVGVAALPYFALTKKVAVEATPHRVVMRQAPVGEATEPDPESVRAGSYTTRERLATELPEPSLTVRWTSNDPAFT
jgi:hypothetical protein